jgi:hypothetical protein
MHGMKAAALHAFKHQQMAAIVYNGNGNRNTKFGCPGKRGIHHHANPF